MSLVDDSLSFVSEHSFGGHTSEDDSSSDSSSLDSDLSDDESVDEVI